MTASLAELRGPVRTMDDDLADLVDQIPGFGGLFYDASGALTVQLTDPGRLTEARAAVAEFLGRRAAGHPGRLAQIAAEVNGMRVRAAQYDYRQLLIWYRGEVLRNIGPFGGLTVTGIDERRNRIVIRVWDGSRVGEVRAWAARLAVPKSAIEVAVINPPLDELPRVLENQSQSGECDPLYSFVPCDDPPGDGDRGGWLTVRDRLRPTPGGAQLAYFSRGDTVRACTLGYNVVRWVNGHPEPERYLLTAAHCARNQPDDVGVVRENFRMYQPEPWDSLGIEVLDPPFHDRAYNPDCPAGRLCRFSDAALLRYFDPNDSYHGRIAVPNLGSLRIESFADVSYVEYAFLEQRVRKIGSTTGHTAGTVTDTCDHYPYPLWSGQDTGRTWLCQGRASYTSQTGDSGGPVGELLAGNNFWAVGIHRASGGIFSHVDAALNEFYLAFPGGAWSVIRLGQ
jgi:hypothetical protein